jgi:glycosyltransferase involved in cell wall biosynthesis
MPVYKNEAHIAEAIDSILGQTYEDFELVISNDGSPDGCHKIIERFADQDSRIVSLSREKNQGIVFTRNELTDQAKGEWLATMDADDISLPDRFERQMAFIDENPEYDVVGASALLIDPEGNPMCEMGGGLSHEAIDSHHMKTETGAAFVSPTSFIRVEALRTIGGYRAEGRHAEDFDLMLRLAEKGKICTMPETLLLYRQHLGSIGYHFNKDQRNAIRWAVEEAHKRRGVAMPVGLFEDRVPSRTPSCACRQWSEWSLRGGNVGLARRYGLRAISLAPWSPRGWRALAQAYTPGAQNKSRAELAASSQHDLQSSVVPKAK